jgi:putative copper resistance protein D
MEIFIHCMPLWVELTALAICTGILIFSIWVLSPEEHSDHNRLWRIFTVSVAVAMAGSVMDLIQRVAEMSGETLLSSFPFVPTVLFKTHSGRVWIIRIVCFAIMLIAGKLRKIRGTRPVLIGLICLDAIVALTVSASGHASDKGDFSVAEIMDWIHLVSAMLWAGGIFVLSFVILPRRADLNGQALQTLARHAARFSVLAGIAVSFVVLTACYNVLVYVGSVQALMHTSYGLTVATKAVLLFLLLLLAAYNRYISVPGLSQLAGLDETTEGSFFSRLVRRFYSKLSLNKTGVDILLFFKRAVRLEAILLTGLLLCAALLRHEIPARHAIHGDHTGAPLHEHMRH